MFNKTEKAYWEKKAKHTKLPCLIDSEYLSRKKFDEYCNKLLKSNNYNSIIEIGCFPGRWLIYFNRAFHFDIYGIDYSNILCDISRKNLEMCKIKGKIFCQDLFDHKIEEKFDIVFSAGFVEHYDNIKYPLQKCYDLLKTKGLLITMVPNIYRNIHEFFANTFVPKTFLTHTRVSTTDLKNVYEKLGLTEISVTPLGIWSASFLSKAERFKIAFKIYKRIDRYMQTLIKRIGCIPETKFSSPYIIASGMKP